MHRSVAARLAKPDITLFEALRMGGFDYPTNDDASVVDMEKVTLGQRKNQLSRRLRLARKQSPKDFENDDDNDEYESADFGSTRAPPVPSSTNNLRRAHSGSIGGLSSDAQTELNKLLQQSNRSRNAGKREASDILSEDDANPEAAEGVLMHDPVPKRARIAKFHPDYAPLFVPPAGTSRNSYSSIANSLVGGPGTANAIANGVTSANSSATHGLSPLAMGMGMGMGMGIPPGASMAAVMGGSPFPGSALFPNAASLFPTGGQTQARPSAVAIASLSATAQAVGMTLEQLAVTLGSSTTNLAKVLTECNSSNTDTLTKQQEMALNLYQSESRALYSRCMLLAGIDPSLCQESSTAYLQFSLSAWQTEGRRLRDLMGNTKANSVLFDLSQPRRNSFSSASIPAPAPAPGASESPDHDHHHHHHDHDKDDSPFGRHIHRLEGKCGHKAIIHQPKDGPAHIDFVIGDIVECYHGIEPVGTSFNSLWPSQYKCEDLEGSCSNKCASNISQVDEATKALAMNVPMPEPKIIPLSDINIADPEWNLDFNGSIDGSLMGLFKLGGRGDDNSIA
jgi:hypothetical protein